MLSSAFYVVAILFIVDNTDNDHVVSIKIGETASEDRQNGFRMPIWDQIDIACDIITSDPKLKDGYHGLGLSQGSQFLRFKFYRFKHRLYRLKHRFQSNSSNMSRTTNGQPCHN